MLRNFIATKILENLEFQATPAQEALIRELGIFIADADPNEIMLVKGYAGTGKTTLLRSVVRVLDSLKMKSILLAPTGRATKVLSSYTGQSAWTIHKKIYRQKTGSDGMGDFVLDRNPHRNCCFIVDEASMIGDYAPDSVFGSGDLLKDLMNYKESGKDCKLILVGDTAQLPPVGLALSPALSRERLEMLGYRVREMEMKDIIRQAQDSGILRNATAIRDLINREEVAIPGFNFDSFDDISMLGGEDLLEAIGSCYDRFGTGETIVITRSNKRANRFNAGIRNQILWREEHLSAGDLLMVVKNNYFWKDEEARIDFIANGDILQVERVLGTEEAHGHRFSDVEVTFPDYGGVGLQAKVMLDVIDLETPSLGRNEQRELYLSVAEDYPDTVNKRQLAGKISLDPYFNALQVKFAYAVTCHKSQGGQWKAVFLDQGYFTDEMLSIEYLRWLYTAFTRSSDRLYLVNLAAQFVPD
jgi:exodeoxyribonuclease-5